MQIVGKGPSPVAAAAAAAATTTKIHPLHNCTAEESGIITLKAEEGDAVAVGEVVCLIDTDAAKPEVSGAVKKEVVENKTEENQIEKKPILAKTEAENKDKK